MKLRAILYGQFNGMDGQLITGQGEWIKYMAHSSLNSHTRAQKLPKTSPETPKPKISKSIHVPKVQIPPIRQILKRMHQLDIIRLPNLAATNSSLTLFYLTIIIIINLTPIEL
jgi:hypothetical protein